MIVKELIAKLQEFPEDMVAVIHGWDGGYDDIDEITPIEVMFNSHPTGGCCGVHGAIFDFYTEEDCPLKERTKVLNINATQSAVDKSKWT